MSDRMEAQIDRDAVAAMDKAGLPDDAPIERFRSLQTVGRGAVSNPAVRFDAHAGSPFDDGWATLSQDVGELLLGRQLRT